MIQKGCIRFYANIWAEKPQTGVVGGLHYGWFN
jgi:hypothetical protein